MGILSIFRKKLVKLRIVRQNGANIDYYLFLIIKVFTIMRIWGKVLGGFFGFMFGHIFGMLLGIFLGHRFDRATAINFNVQNGLFGNTISSQARQKLFFDSTFSVMGHIAKAKGKVTQTDIQVANAYMDQMRLHGEARSLAQHAFSLCKNVDFPLQEILTEHGYGSGQTIDG